MSKNPVFKYKALEASGESVNANTEWPTFLVLMVWVAGGGGSGARLKWEKAS